MRCNSQAVRRTLANYIKYDKTIAATLQRRAMASIVMSSSDEDSFVILGSTPTPSILDQLEITRSPQSQEMHNGGVVVNESPSLLSSIDFISAGSATAAAAASGAPPPTTVAAAASSSTPASSLTSAAILQHSRSGDQLPVPVGIRVEQWRTKDFVTVVAQLQDHGVEADSDGELSLSVDSLSQPFSFLQVAAAGDGGGAAAGAAAAGAGDVVVASGDAMRPQPVSTIEQALAAGTQQSHEPFKFSDEFYKRFDRLRDVEMGSYAAATVADSQTMDGSISRSFVKPGGAALRQSVMDEFPSLAVSQDEEEVQKMESFLCDQVEMKGKSVSACSFGTATHCSRLQRFFHWFCVQTTWTRPTR